MSAANDPAWRPDDELHELAVATLEGELKNLSTAKGGAETVLTALEAAGTLTALGAADEARRIAATTVDELRARIRTAAAEDLDDAAAIVVRDAPLCLTLDPDSVPEQLRQLLDALRARDRAELVMLGAETLGVREALSDEYLASCWSFDDVVGPELWQLVPLRRLRNVEVEWVSPSFLQRFWWRTRHEDLSDQQLRDIALRGGPTLDELERRRRSLRTISQVIAERSASGLQLAAAAKGNRVALGTADGIVDIGVRGTELVLDVLVDIRPGSAPSVELDGQRIEVVPEADAEQRWVAQLGGDGSRRDGLVIVLPTVDGDRTITLEDLAMS